MLYHSSVIIICIIDQGWKFHCKYKIDENKSLNIFEMVVGTCELAKDFLIKNCWYFFVDIRDAKDIKCPLEWWKKHETMFPIVSFLTLSKYYGL